MSMALEMVAERVAVLEKQMASLLANQGDEVVEKPKAPKKAKKEKKDKDSDDEKPKTKRISGYILYSKTILCWH